MASAIVRARVDRASVRWSGSWRLVLLRAAECARFRMPGNLSPALHLGSPRSQSRKGCWRRAMAGMPVSSRSRARWYALVLAMPHLLRV